MGSHGSIHEDDAAMSEKQWELFWIYTALLILFGIAMAVSIWGGRNMPVIP